MQEQGPGETALRAEIDRLSALLEKRANDLRLVELNSNGEMILEGGLFHVIAAYLAQMLETRDPHSGQAYSNYVEIAMCHETAGPMVLSLQRKDGKTPHELRRDAERERDEAIEALHAAINRPKGVVPSEAERWYRPQLAARLAHQATRE